MINKVYTLIWKNMAVITTNCIICTCTQGYIPTIQWWDSASSDMSVWPAISTEFTDALEQLLLWTVIYQFVRTSSSGRVSIASWNLKSFRCNKQIYLKTLKPWRLLTQSLGVVGSDFLCNLESSDRKLMTTDTLNSTENGLCIESKMKTLKLNTVIEESTFYKYTGSSIKNISSIMWTKMS